MEAIELGPLYFNGRFESDIKSVCDSERGLVVIVDTLDESGNDSNLKFTFGISLAYRYLDETDLVYYWDTGLFFSRHHIYQIVKGGWSNGTVPTKKIMHFTHAKNHNEYFITTSNGCMNIVSEQPPTIEVMNV